MGQTTTHTTGAVLNGSVPTQQPTQAPCPDWCDEHHTVGGHDSTVVHEGTPTPRIETLDADFSIRPVLYHGPDDISTEVVLTIRDHAGPTDGTIIFGLNIPDAQLLIGALLEVVNRTLPVEEQQQLGEPGFEFIPYDEPWVG
jgi:hypothetical protein